MIYNIWISHPIHRHLQSLLHLLHPHLHLVVRKIGFILREFERNAHHL